MYCSFFGFSEKPFETAPDPRFFFPSETHQEALSSVIYGVAERKGFISLTGEAGTGKTTLIRSALEALREKKVHTVSLPQPRQNIQEILREILGKLNISPGEGDKSSLVHRLNEFLLEALSRKENLALLIDQAEGLDREVLEELRLLSNLETSTSKLLQIVLAGRPELDRRLDSRELRQLKQRITIRREIRPLTEEESRKYIGHRLNVVGPQAAAVFEPEAIDSICRAARGIPLEINRICDLALQIAYGRDRKKIDAALAKDAIRGKTPPPRPAQPSLVPPDKKTAPKMDAPPAAEPVITPPAPEKTPGKPVPRVEGPETLRLPLGKKEEKAAAAPEMARPEMRPSRSPGRKLMFVLAGLVCLAVVFYLGRGYLKNGSEERSITAARVSPQESALQAKPETPARQKSEPRAESIPAPTAPGAKLPSPATPAPPVRLPDEKAKVPGAPPPVDKPAGTKPEPPSPPPAAKTAPATPVPTPSMQTVDKKIVNVERGDTVSGISQKYYQTSNIFLLDKIMEFNPEITNVHLITINQKIKVPPLTESSLLFRASDGTWKIHLGTFSSPPSIDSFRSERALRGKTIEVIPRKVAPRETWYRVVAGRFSDQKECLAVLAALKAKGSLPVLGKPK